MVVLNTDAMNYIFLFEHKYGFIDILEELKIMTKLVKEFCDEFYCLTEEFIKEYDPYIDSEDDSESEVLETIWCEYSSYQDGHGHYIWHIDHHDCGFCLHTALEISNQTEWIKLHHKVRIEKWERKRNYPRIPTISWHKN